MVTGLTSNKADAGVVYLMVYSQTSKKLYICISRTNQDSTGDAKLILVQETTTLIVHESYHHASWSNIVLGTSSTRNFFSVGSTESLTFSDNSSMSRAEKFGFISRVDTSSSCLADPGQTEFVVSISEQTSLVVDFSDPYQEGGG